MRTGGMTCPVPLPRNGRFSDGKDCSAMLRAMVQKACHSPHAQLFHIVLAQIKEVEAAAERAAAQSAAIIEDAMAQAEELRRKAAQETHSQVQAPPFLAPSLQQ